MESEGWGSTDSSYKDLFSVGSCHAEQKLYTKHTGKCCNSIIFWADLLDLELGR